MGIRLIRLADSVIVPPSHASASPQPGVEVPLRERLLDVVGTVADTSPPSGLGSGWFCIPVGLTSDVTAWPGLGWPASWPTHGWPTGVYAFEVDLAGVSGISLPFVIAAGHAP